MVVNLQSYQNTPQEAEKNLSSKQRQAALLLASGSTIDNTARVVGVSEKTVDTWKKKPAFKEAMRQAEDDLYNEALSILKKAMRPAIACLIRNMNEKVSAYVQVQAASKLLEQGIELHKIQELELKIAELQDLISVRGSGRRIP